MNIVGRRGSSESGWTWSRPPWGPRRRRATLPFLPLVGGFLIALGIAAVILGVWLLEPEDGAPAAADATPTPSPSPTATLEPSPAPSPEATPTPPPTATPLPSGLGGFSIAAWDGLYWRNDFPLEGLAYREGQSVPVLVRIERTRSDTTYPMAVRYDCRAFDYLTSYDSFDGTESALASGGPGRAIPDGSARIPDGAPRDTLSVWGGTFAAVGPLAPGAGCEDEKTLDLSVRAAAGTVYVLWAAHIAEGASAAEGPLRLAVDLPGDGSIGLEIAPESVLAD